MLLIPLLSECSKCGGKFNFLWPLEGGVCDVCLVKNFTSKEVLLKIICGCDHSKVIQLFSHENMEIRNEEK